MARRLSISLLFMQLSTIPSRICLTFLFFAALTMKSQAHPGHQQIIVPASQPAHWLVEPEHALSWLLALSACCALCSAWRKRSVNPRS